MSESDELQLSGTLFGAIVDFVDRQKEKTTDALSHTCTPDCCPQALCLTYIASLELYAVASCEFLFVGGLYDPAMTWLQRAIFKTLPFWTVTLYWPSLSARISKWAATFIGNLEQSGDWSQRHPGREQLLGELAFQKTHQISIGLIHATSAHDYVFKFGERLSAEIRSVLGKTWVSKFQDPNATTLPCITKKQFLSIRRILKQHPAWNSHERMRLIPLLESEQQVLFRTRLSGCQFKSATCDFSPILELVQAMRAQIEKVGIFEKSQKAITKLPTRPPDKAFQAWQLRELVGISKQGEIADIMTKQGIPATQGQVSKWLKAVDEWRAAGGVMPEVGTLDGQPQSVDPDILDMGARQDGLTPRQRPRRDSDADE